VTKHAYLPGLKTLKISPPDALQELEEILVGAEKVREVKGSVVVRWRRDN
jgi:hypothetical protein